MKNFLTHKDKVKEFAYFISPIISILVLWEILSRYELINPIFFPPPSKIVKTMFILSRAPIEGKSSTVLMYHFYNSLYRVIIGFLLGTTIGITFGVLIGLNRYAYRFFSPVISFIMPIPTLAWVPFFLMWFGMGAKTIITVLSLASFFPVVYNTMMGVNSVDKKHLWVAEMVGASKASIIFMVLLPGAMNYIIAGSKLAMGFCWRALVGAEMLASLSSGLGFMIFHARTYMAADVMFVGIFIFAIIGYLTEMILFKKIEGRSIERWGVVR